MNFTYTINTSCVPAEDGEMLTTYGIDIIHNGQNIESIPDIFTDKTQTKEFITLINKHRLSTIHIYEVIEDLL